MQQSHSPLVPQACHHNQAPHPVLDTQRSHNTLVPQACHHNQAPHPVLAMQQSHNTLVPQACHNNQAPHPVLDTQQFLSNQVCLNRTRTGRLLVSIRLCNRACKHPLERRRTCHKPKWQLVPCHRRIPMPPRECLQEFSSDSRAHLTVKVIHAHTPRDNRFPSVGIRSLLRRPRNLNRSSSNRKCHRIWCKDRCHNILEPTRAAASRRLSSQCNLRKFQIQRKLLTRWPSRRLPLLQQRKQFRPQRSKQRLRQHKQERMLFSNQSQVHSSRNSSASRRERQRPANSPIRGTLTRTTMTRTKSKADSKEGGLLE